MKSKREKDPDARSGSEESGEVSDGSETGSSEIHRNHTDEANSGESGEAPMNSTITQAAEQSRRAEEYLDHLKRLQAEFENFKRRTVKERADTIKYANEQIIVKLLPVMDNLQRGIEHARKCEASEDIVQGLRLVERSLSDLLAEFGVASFVSIDTPFDPNRHEAMYTMERDDVEDNTVIEEMEKGYTMHERIIRAARVVVSKMPAPAE